MEMSPKQIAKLKGRNTAISLIVAKDPNHPYLLKMSLLGLIQAFIKGGRTEAFKSVLWDRIQGGRESFSSLFSATKYCGARINRAYPWEDLLTQLLGKVENLRQWKQVIHLCSSKDENVVYYHRWRLMQELIPKATTIEALIELRAFARGEDEKNSAGKTMPECEFRTKDSWVKNINQRIFELAKKSPELLLAIATENKFDLPKDLRDLAIAQIKI